MLKTQLSLEVSKNYNQKVMRLFDTSHYCEEETIDNLLVEVLAVNKSTWTTFHVKKAFSLVLNSSSLRYSKASSNTDLIDLPDGIYEIKHSYKPNLFTVNHFYHLRTVEIENKIRSERDKLLSNKCSISREEFIINRNNLREIEEYVEAAKYKVEECHEKAEGIELYKWAEKLLEDYSNECQC